MSDKIKQMLSMITSGATEQAQQVFNELMIDKVSQKLEDLRVDVASQMFNHVNESMKRQPKGHTIEAHGVKGMKSTPWRQTFKNSDHLADWAEKHDAEVHGVRDLEHVMSEEVEQIDELSKSTLGSYINKASNDAVNKGFDLGMKKATSDEVDRFTNRHMKDKFNKQDEIKKHLGADNASYEKTRVKAAQRLRGIGKATNRLTKEEYELDEETQRQLDEVMASDATAADYIHDFVHSDNPKFAGKSKKERMKMALGAFYAKKGK